MEPILPVLLVMILIALFLVQMMIKTNREKDWIIAQGLPDNNKDP
ncbi:Uncharacterised protein [Chlamydia trachomatis]|nr:Uncharacterised protein [Chlamydia trachomatis]